MTIFLGLQKSFTIITRAGNVISVGGTGTYDGSYTIETKGLVVVPRDILS